MCFLQSIFGSNQFATANHSAKSEKQFRLLDVKVGRSRGNGDVFRRFEVADSPRKSSGCVAADSSRSGVAQGIERRLDVVRIEFGQ